MNVPLGPLHLMWRDLMSEVSLQAARVVRSRRRDKEEEAAAAAAEAEEYCTALCSFLFMWMLII